VTDKPSEQGCMGAVHLCFLKLSTTSNRYGKHLQFICNVMFCLTRLRTTLVFYSSKTGVTFRHSANFVQNNTHTKKRGELQIRLFVRPCNLGGAPRQAQDTRPLACVTPDAAATAQWTTRAVSVRIQFHENSRGFVSRNRRAGRTSRRPPLADIRFTKNERYSFHIFILSGTPQITLTYHRTASFSFNGI
jgi:hypothetical protein